MPESEDGPRSEKRKGTRRLPADRREMRGRKGSGARRIDWERGVEAGREGRGSRKRSTEGCRRARTVLVVRNGKGRDDCPRIDRRCGVEKEAARGGSIGNGVSKREEREEEVGSGRLRDAGERGRSS